MIELAAAEFAESQNGELSRWLARCLAKLRITLSINLAHANLRQLRQFGGCFFERGHISDFAERNPRHFLVFPTSQRAEIVGYDIGFHRPMKLVRHVDVVPGLNTNGRLGQPKQKIRVLYNSCRTDARNGKKMKQGRFTEREFLYELFQWTRLRGPHFTQLKQCRSELRRIQRIR